MKSLRYLLVVAWLITMTTLGMFSNIESLGGVFDTAQRQGDAYGHPAPLENFTITAPSEVEAVPEKAIPAPEKALQCCAKKKPVCRKKKPCTKKKSAETPPGHTEMDSMKSQAVVTAYAAEAMRNQG